MLAVGFVGIVLPLLPGAVLVLAAIVVWGFVEASPGGWTVAAVAAACLIGSQFLKYLVPGRKLRGLGVPTSTLVVGAVLAVVGFFVIPVVGLVLGFVAGVYAAERRRLAQRDLARASTTQAIRAVGLSMLIEISGALAAAAVWFVGAVVV